MPFLPVYAPRPVVAVVMRYQPPAAPLQPPGAEPVSEYETWDTEKLLQFGTYLLKGGRSFNRAIQVFEIAVHRQPSDVQSQLLLGCATVCRFASVSQAARQAGLSSFYEQNYPKRWADWYKSQSDPKSPDYDKPAPAPPRPNVTPDDGRPFSLTPEQAKQELVRLGKQSLIAFNDAASLIEKMPAEKQAEANYVRGWGLFTLRRDGIERRIVRDTPPPAPKKEVVGQVVPPPPSDVLVISPKDVVDCFQKSTKIEPDNSVYWQSLGFALVPDYLDGKPSAGGGTTAFWEGPSPYKKETLDEAVHAFEQALAKKPHDFDVLYSLALVTVQSDPMAAAAYLEKAAQRQGTNATLWYLLAEVDLSQAEKQKADAANLQKKAVGFVERGNAAPDYKPNTLFVPVPAPLRVVWHYREVLGFGADVQIVSFLAWYMKNYLVSEDEQGREESFLRGASALMGMGLKTVNSLADNPALGRYDLFDLYQTNPMGASRLIMGAVACYFAHDTVRDSQKTRPDDQKAKFLKDNESLYQYMKAIDREVIKGN